MASKNLKKIAQKLVGIKWVKYGIIPFILLLFWIFGAISPFNGTPLTVINYHENGAVSSGQTVKKLTKGQTITGQFIAKQNNLGIINIRFVPFTNPGDNNGNKLFFQLKEKGSQNWYYQKEYDSKTIYGNEIFPFGFPKITNSKNREYIFKITSLNGNGHNVLRISNTNPNVILSYSFSKNEIIHPPIHIVSYLYNKVINTLTDEDQLLLSTKFLIPLVIYLIFLIMDLFLLWRVFFEIMIFSLVILDLLVINKIYTGIVLLIYISWITIVILNKMRSISSLYLSAIFIAISIVLLGFHLDTYVDKTSMWAYLFLCLAVFQIFLEIRKGSENNAPKV